MRSLIYNICVAALLGLLAVACGERSYSRWANLPTDGWIYTDTVALLPVDTMLHDNDSLVRGAIRIAVRHENSYRYSNLWLEMTYHTDGRRLIRDTINLRLADVYGRWIGSGFGASYQQEALISSSSVIDVTQPVALRHIMRVDTLRGIEQIGIEVVR